MRGFSLIREFPSILRSVEAECLGWELPPIPIALIETPIAPDQAGSWCLRCGESVAAAEITSRGCATCRGQRLPWRYFVRVAEYSSHLARRINQVKHVRWSAMAEALGVRLADQCSSAGIGCPDAVLSIPMPWLRRWWRGIDHGRELAAGVARRLGAPSFSLGSQQSGLPQASRCRSDRLRARGRFGLTPRDDARIKGKRVLLVDDVRTTGATLRQFARLLRTHGAATVDVGVVAVVPNPRRRRWEQ